LQFTGMNFASANGNSVAFIATINGQGIRRSSYTAVDMTINGGESGGQRLRICLRVVGPNWDASCQWRDLPMLTGGDNKMSFSLNDFNIQNGNNNGQPMTIGAVEFRGATDAYQSVTIRNVRFTDCTGTASLINSGARFPAPLLYRLSALGVVWAVFVMARGS
jgi:hypothetical protein